jgi:hypothetical protein
MTRINTLPDVADITYSPLAGINNGFFYLPDISPQTVSVVSGVNYLSVNDLTGYSAIAYLFDGCGGASLGQLTSSANQLKFFTSPSETFDVEDRMTGIVTSYTAINPQGVEFAITPTMLQGFTWTEAYYVMVLIAPSGVISPFLRGSLKPMECSC